MEHGAALCGCALRLSDSYQEVPPSQTPLPCVIAFKTQQDGRRRALVASIFFIYFISFFYESKLFSKTQSAAFLFLLINGSIKFLASTRLLPPTHHLLLLHGPPLPFCLTGDGNYCPRSYLAEIEKSAPGGGLMTS